MIFDDLSKKLEVVESISSRNQKIILLAQLFKDCSSHEAKLISYLLLGVVRPLYEGNQFNVSERTLLKIVCVLCDFSLSDVKNLMKKKGDLGTVVAQQNFVSKEKLSIEDVFNNLNDIMDVSGVGAQSIKEKKILGLLKSLSSVSQKYIIRIILGKLRLGFSDMTLLDAVSWMHVGDKSIRKKLEDVYNIFGDLGEIIRILKTKDLEALNEIKIIPGIPIRPAAAERLPNVQAIYDKIGNCVAQLKLDGLRLQIHVNTTKKKSPIVRFFSRNLQDMSEMFPDLKKSMLQIPVNSLIIEGEAIAYDQKKGTFLAFQDTVKRKRKYEVEASSQKFPLKLFIFDILYYDGVSMLSKTHQERRKVLLGLVKNFPKAINNILLIEEVKISSVKTLEKYFDEVVTEGLEGLVVKKIDAVYQPGKRNFNWIKLKQKEANSLDDTLDCVILGYYFGKGKRAGLGIGALLVGVYNKKKDCFQTIAKVGIGLTDQEWIDQKKMCNKFAVLVKPENVECAKELYPDVWVAPEVVCMVKANEITKSPLHTAGINKNQKGYALRFPRIVGYRNDKKAVNSTEISEVHGGLYTKKNRL
jgi:DNA ligase 1